MKISVLNKTIFNSVMRYYNITDDNVEEQSAYFISINYVGDNSWFKSNHKNVHVTHFNDTMSDTEPDAITKEQAIELIEFIKSIPSTTNQILIHCSAGISRSGAVGSVIADYFKVNWNEFIQLNPKIQPNSFIRKLLMDQINVNN